ncbi:cas scaffolding protein family member 4 [Alligator mississippiensis]|uniref:Cas scaffolding protein family member 4 n=1 Tax=Alligator mississippiensis TaxID=8496 RepID=A0A151NZJ3_ALLMI|nr:cas scaffolding protein family member 4 [Alligator mississippiensis]
MDKNTGINTAAKNTLAKALYDNKAECSDELAFRKGDILTVLDQNVIGSEGWWKCSLHGRQGLAPANRLQLLAGLQEGMLSPSSQHDSQELPSNQPNIYQVPKAPKSTLSSSVYEQMDGWVKPSSTVLSLPTQEMYQVPASSAQLFSEKSHTLTNQHLLTLPRVSQASASNIQSYVYDVPSPQRQESLLTQSYATPPTARKVSTQFSLTEYFQEGQKQLYNIPSSPEKAKDHIQQDSLASTMYDVPPTREHDIPIQNTSQRKYVGYCNTLPNPRKSEWIYDIPVSPEKPGLKQHPPNHSLEKQMLYDVPPARYGAGVQNAASTLPAAAIEGKLANPQEYDVPPIQKKLTFPDAPLYAVPSSCDMLRLRKNGNYRVPLSFLSAKFENQNCEQNIYDIPKVLPTALQNRKGTEKNNGSFEDHTYNVPLQLSRDAKLEQDRLSFDSVDSRTSTISTSPSTSVESFSLSSEEEPAQEIKLDLDVAIEMLTKLQHSVSSSVASLMLYVSSKWRYQEHLEANIEEVHRAVDHIKVSLGEFLNFAQGIKANASYLSDNNLQTRIKKQLQILVDSFHILVETREALNNCSWSLQVLVIKKPQNNPDDLDRFVMVARAIPDDIRRFVSIIIANGKLLFKKNDNEQKTTQPKLNTEHKMAKPVPAPRKREFNSLQRNKPNKSELSSEKSRKNVSEDCDYVHLQKYQDLEQAAKHLSPKEVATKNGDSKQKVIPEKPVQNKQDSSKKIIFSENCRLCFGALQKAISVFTNSLSNNQPPEVFIGHSKLIIMVGQKLVDFLCQETQEKDTRNDILHSSSQFCSLLKNLALATKNAAVQYPNTDAVKELLGQADTLSKYTQQFQDTMEGCNLSIL